MSDIYRSSLDKIISGRKVSPSTGAKDCLYGSVNVTYGDPHHLKHFQFRSGIK